MHRLAITTTDGDEIGGLLDIYADHVVEIRQDVQSRLQSSPAGDVLSPYFERGKMVRARLVLAAADAVAGRPDLARAGAVAIELLHGASLVHDDIIDRSPRRRGLVAVHEVLGSDQALVLGDELLLQAFAAIVEGPGPAARVLGATQVLATTAHACCCGQLRELRAGRWVTEREYFSIVRGKTAAQFVAAVSVGAILGGADDAELRRLREFAEALGIAFQIADDLLDLLGDAETMGKPIANSLALGRPLLPLIYLRHLDAGVAESLTTNVVASDRPDRALAELIDVLEHRGVLDNVRRVQKAHADAAFAALSGFEHHADLLRALATGAVASMRPASGQSASATRVGH